MNHNRHWAILAESYTQHEPITIVSNADFASQGWSGTGNEDTPFIIEGLYITNSSTCISIGNTDAYFEIRNCLISAPSGAGIQISYGIVLDNVTHASVYNCYIEHHYFGISVISSSYCTLSLNDVMNNYHFGFRITESYSCNFSNNEATNNVDYGFYFSSSSSSVLMNNTATSNHYGIYLHSSDHFTLTHNTVRNNGYSGIFLWYSFSCVLVSNVASNCPYGIYLGLSCTENLIYLNKLFSNPVSNGYDDGFINNWDNGTHGNYWDDYDGSGTYSIIGSAASVDNHPYLHVLPPPPNGITTTTTTTTGMTTTIITTTTTNGFDLVSLFLTIISLCSGGIIVVVVILTIRERRVATNTVSYSEEEILD